MDRIVKWKKLSAVLVFVLMVAAAAGCKLLSKPEADIQTYAEAVGHLNESAAKEFNLDLAQLREEREASSKQAFAAFIPAGIDTTKLDETTDALYEKMMTLNIKTKLISKDGDTARVQVTTDYIDYIGILPGVMRSFRADLAADADKMNAMSQQDALHYVMGKMFTKIADGIKNAEIKGQNTFETTAKYDDKLGKWVPEEEQAFQQTLYRDMLMGEDKK